MSNQTQKEKYNQQFAERTIRVFISSTFRDMHAERDYLVKFTFPQLRKLCEERGVTWTDVDLRWGITDEQVSERAVLPLCLEEIKRSKPYFIGLLGERYGWVPDTIPNELLETEGWLEEFKGKKSVTELEILHGVLLNPAMASHAFFYFRDSSYVETITDECKADFISENEESGEKLKELKNAIRSTEFPVRENYLSPEALGQWVLEDFSKIINELYPEENEKEPVNYENLAQDAYAKSRRQVFIGRQIYFDKLDIYANDCNTTPLVITGESGSGKSALLANWAKHYCKQHPDTVIIEHYIGASPDSADPTAMLRRLMNELKQKLGIETEISQNISELIQDFPAWLLTAASRQKFVLIIDALNLLETAPGAQKLSWLPVIIPDNARLILSSLPGENLNECIQRGWPQLYIDLLDVENRKQLIVEYLGRYGKHLSNLRVSEIAAAEPAANPLYLKTLLDELKVYGIHERLQLYIDDYLKARNPAQLYEMIIARWQQDYGQDLVRQSLCLIWSARRGLSEVELLDLLGSNSSPLPRVKFTPFFLAAENALINRGGLLNIAHEYLRSAIKSYWFEDTNNINIFHRQLADYFLSTTNLTNRKADELPWHLLQIKDYEALKACLVDLKMFSKLYYGDSEYDLMRYWTELEKVGFSRGKEYVAACSGFKDEVSSILINDIGYFLFRSSYYDEAEQLARRVMTIDEQSNADDRWKTAKNLNNLAQILRATNRWREAEPMLRKALNIWEGLVGEQDPEVATVLINLAMLLKDTNRLEEAEGKIGRALEIDEHAFGPNHRLVARDLNKLTQVLQLLGRPTQAEPLARRALRIEEQYFGNRHPMVAKDLANLAGLLQDTGRLREAEPLYHKALEIDESFYGNNHPEVALVLNNLAQLLQDDNRNDEAEILMWRTLAIDEGWFGPDDANVARDLNNLMALFYAQKRFSEAEPLCRRALKIHERVFGMDSPQVATDINNLSLLLQETGRLEEAEPMMLRALHIVEKSFGDDHPNVATPLSNLARFFISINRFDEAEEMMRRSIKILLHSTVINRAIHPRLEILVRNYLNFMRNRGSSPVSARSRLDQIFESESVAFLLPDILHKISNSSSPGV